MTPAPFALTPLGEAAEDDPHFPRVTRLADLLADWEADATAAHQAHVTGVPRGPVTGLAGVDRQLGGALQPGVHILHGGPGAGKTAFALQVLANAGCPALMLSCEMGLLELMRRITARVTGTFLGRLKSGELTPSESLALAHRAAIACPNVVLVDATRTFAPPAWIRDAADATRGDSSNLLIVVDSIHCWADAAPGEATEYEALNAALAGLRTLASVLGCPILAVAERNRASIKSGGVSAGAGSRKLEYSGETVIDLDRAADARPDGAGEVPVTLRFSKNRHGAHGQKVDLAFHGALQRFREAGE